MKFKFTMIGAVWISILYGSNLASIPAPIVKSLAQHSVLVKPKREGGLQQLRKSLELVRAKQREAKSTPYESPCCVDVSFLVGLHKSAIQKALGAPHVCKETASAPCKEIGAWFYSFYYLPPGWRGGGPELLLKFDKQETCISAKWVGSR